MLNPTPVERRSTPYSRPLPSRPNRTTLPRTLTAPVPTRTKPRWRRALPLFLLAFLVAGGTFAYAQFSSLLHNVLIQHQGENSSILGYSEKAQLDPSHFSQAGDGRFNLVIVGVGGVGHDGAYLTDSIQVVSLDTLNKKISLTSVPRDLYVNVPDYGYSKINAVYEIGEQRQKGGGPLLVRQVVGQVLGISISNFGYIDFSGAKQLVDSMGGVDVDVPAAIDDPAYPCDDDIHYCPFSISAGMHHLDGSTALKYMRTRHADSDYGRSGRQQQVASALKKKALSLGTLSNPSKVSAIVQALGDHIKTDMTPAEIQSFVAVYRDITSADTSSNVLDDSASLGLLTSRSDPFAGFISYPLAGKGDYSQVHRWFQKNSPDPLIAKEGATVTVVAGGYTTTKQVQQVVDTLNDYGYTAVLGKAPANRYSYTKSQLYDTAGGKKPFSHNYLSSQYGVAAQSGSPLGSGSDFELIYVPLPAK